MNAIILAAGMGTRLRPLTNEIPKCMVTVCGVPMVERQIMFLHEIGVKDITLVSGYKAAALDYLKEKYSVDIVYNDRFETCNNIWSMYLVRDRLKDTYVLEGDVFLNRNYLKPSMDHSAYFSVKKDHYEREWGLLVDSDNRLLDIVPGDGQGYIMSGISYWTASDSAKIVKALEDRIAAGGYDDLFWDNIVLDIYKNLSVSVIETSDIYEIDTVAELHAVEKEIGL